MNTNPKLSLEDFKKKLIERSSEITTSFDIDESCDAEFEEYYDAYLIGLSIDEIIENAFNEAYKD